MDNQADFIIVGNGLAGCYIGYFLLEEGYSIRVYQPEDAVSASQYASGVINPITGRRVVKSWQIDTILPFAVETYQVLEKKFDRQFIQCIPMLNFHWTQQMETAFELKKKEAGSYIFPFKDFDKLKDFFLLPPSISQTFPCYIVDIKLLLETWKKFLLSKQLLVQEKFDYNALQANPSQKIIFCEGNEYNQWFNFLPFRKNKGEVIIADIPALSRDFIYKSSLHIVPYKAHQWWIGSSYQWTYNTLGPTKDFRETTIAILNKILKIPFKIEAHWAAERPASFNRRPLMGWHPENRNWAIFNGMGSKGCSLIPYFAAQFVKSIADNTKNSYWEWQNLSKS